ncbi:hypothetical protein [Luteibacter sp.]|uniref:hypothetical protein n=1 Tax=Luteibacter sp. TaxID=1886636 RepID=UPI003F7EC243
MTSTKKVGAHWAVVEVIRLDAPRPSWKVRWALYADETVAMRATSPIVNGAAASGSTAVFGTEAEAMTRAAEDASGSEALLSTSHQR